MQHSREYYIRVRKKKRQRNLILCVVALFILSVILLGLRSCTKNNGGGNITPSEDNSSVSSTEPVDKTKTATIGVTGDIMVHGAQLEAAKRNDGSYDFNPYFEYVKSYYNRFDCFVANLEVTFGTTANYSGYPAFNTPVSLLDAMKNGGIDTVITANNHSYDTGHKGFVNTMSELRKYGIDFTGTRENKNDNKYIIKEINGIKVGMINYTYSQTNASGAVVLNNVMSAEDSALINTFDYTKTDSFYKEAETQLKQMREAGADAVIIYMHWGAEYQTKQNASQKAISQRLADIGYDVIVGGHPHVIQPFSILTGRNGNKTYCIYSLGNAVSNQRKEILTAEAPKGHTEDGMIFGITLKKSEEGVTTVEEISITPTWVDMFNENGQKYYRIIPLDNSVNDWKTLGAKNEAAAKASYNRTLKCIGSEYNTYRAEKGLPILTEIN